MSKFNIGDMVIGNNESPYGVTCKGWIGVVVPPEKYGYNTSDDKLIIVENEEDGEFVVNEDYFDLYKAAVPVDVTEFLNLMFESGNCA